jgi:hypothetical protein
MDSLKRYRQIKTDTIKNEPRDIVNPESEAAVKMAIIEPSRSEYSQHEFDDLVYKDAGLSNIPKELFNDYMQLFRFRLLEASHWEGLGTRADYGNPYKSIAILCNVENKFDMKVLNSREAKEMEFILSPPTRATIRQFRRDEGKPNVIQRAVQPKQEEEGF